MTLKVRLGGGESHKLVSERLGNHISFPPPTIDTN